MGGRRRGLRRRAPGGDPFYRAAVCAPRRRAPRVASARATATVEWQRGKRAPVTLLERIDALLPQTQCRRCGYDGCRPYAAAIAQGVARDQPLSARRRANRGRAGGAARRAAAAPRSRLRGRAGPLRRGPHRRGGVHRLRAMHRRLSGRCDRRRRQADAHGARRPLYRLRALRAPLPGRLHRTPAGRAALDAHWTPNGRGNASPTTPRGASEGPPRVARPARRRARPGRRRRAARPASSGGRRGAPRPCSARGASASGKRS